jgi:uncharacterized protein DUF4287/uncharacterized protein DUF5655
MATVEEGLQAQIRNIEATYGKPMSEWLAIIAASGLAKHTDIVNMLKNDYGMTHGAAHRVSILARQNAAQQTGADQDGDPVSALYTGKKASLRPIHDALMSAIHGFGDDIELAPKKGYVSLRRRKQSAMIQPSGAGRIDLGLILPDVPADGAHYLGAPAIVAQSATAEILRRHDDQRRPLPTITFNDELVIQAGRHRVELRYHGPNHQDGNIFIHLPAQQVLMLVDVIVPGWVPFHALGGATDVAGYLSAHDAAVGYDFATLVAGHLTRTGTMHDVHVARQYLNEVRDDCTRARQAVSASAIAAAAGEDKWELASSLFNRLAATAAAELIPRWADRLGGTAAFTQSHCLAMAIALAHEWGIEPAD